MDNASALTALSVLQESNSERRRIAADYFAIELGTDIGRYDQRPPGYLDHLIDCVNDLGPKCHLEALAFVGIASGYADTRLVPTPRIDPVQCTTLLKQVYLVGRYLAEIDHYRAREVASSYGNLWPPAFNERVRQVIEAASKAIEVASDELYAQLPRYDRPIEWSRSGHADRALLLLLSYQPMTADLLACQIDPEPPQGRPGRSNRAYLTIVRSCLYRLHELELVTNGTVAIARLVGRPVANGSYLPTRLGRRQLLLMYRTQLAGMLP